MLYHEELFTRSLCLNCRGEIPGIGIECGECPPTPASPHFRLCHECFSVGAEIGQHRKEHGYHFFDSGSLALFPGSAREMSSSSKENNGSGSTPTPRWSAREEIRLLDAIEQYGFGNWADISKHIESRGSTEAKEEFVQRYVLGNIGKVSWAERGQGGGQGQDYEFRRGHGLFPQPIDHTVPGDEGPLSPSLTQRLPPLDISSDEMLQLGYMPYRDDYEKEYDNEAEKLVAPLNFAQDDDEVDIGLKLALVDMYSRRLRERARRKRVIRDYQLVCQFFKKDRAKVGNGEGVGPGGGGMLAIAGVGKDQAAKRIQTDEKLFQEKFQPFAQFYNCREFDHLVRNLAKEKDLKLRLQELIKYRNAGITKAEECIEFERSKSGSVGGTPRKRNAAAAGLGPIDEEDEGRNHKRVAGALIQEQSPALIQQLLQPKKEPGVAPVGVQNEKNVVGNVSAIRNPTPPPSSRGAFNSKNLESNGSGVALSPRPNPRVGGGAEGVVVAEELAEADLSLLKERQKVMDDPFTADFIPCADLITREEFELCRKLNLLPTQLLTIKLAFLLGRLDKPNPSDSGDKDENSFNTTTPSSSLPPDMKQNEWEELLQFFKSSQTKQIPNQNPQRVGQVSHS